MGANGRPKSPGAGTAAWRLTGRYRRWALSAVAMPGLLAGACGSVTAGPGLAGAKLAGPELAGARLAGARLAGAALPTYSCVPTGAKAMVVGDPDINYVAAIQSVVLVPRQGGIVMRYQFRGPLQAAPAGVYFSWAVYIYRARSDANDSTRALELQVQDRGAGWEPTGWTILASTYYTSARVEGNIQTDEGHNELSAFFPSGFGNISRPFYWFASQEEYRSYLPVKNGAPVDHNIFGSLTTDCPSGVRPDPNSLPIPAKLLMAAK